MARPRDVLLQHGWQELPTSDGWYWVAGPGRRMKAAQVTFSRGVWWVGGGGGGGRLGRRLVYPCAIPPGVRISQEEKADK